MYELHGLDWDDEMESYFCKGCDNIHKNIREFRGACQGTGPGQEQETRGDPGGKGRKGGGQSSLLHLWGRRPPEVRREGGAGLPRAIEDDLSDQVDLDG